MGSGLACSGRSQERPVGASDASLREREVPMVGRQGPSDHCPHLLLTSPSEIGNQQRTKLQLYGHRDCSTGPVGYLVSLQQDKGSQLYADVSEKANHPPSVRQAP